MTQWITALSLKADGQNPHGGRRPLHMLWHITPHHHHNCHLKSYFKENNGENF